MALLCWLLFILLVEPTWQNWQQQRVKYADLQQQITRLNEQETLLLQQTSIDIDAEHSNKLTLLQREKNILRQKIQQSTQHFISADQMVSLIQNMLENSSSVQLQLLTTAQSKPLMLVGQAENTAPLLYQHSITLQLTGNFKSLVQALEQIEQLPWVVEWKKFEYSVLTHPAAVMTLELVTVSEHENIIKL